MMFFRNKINETTVILLGPCFAYFILQKQLLLVWQFAQGVQNSQQLISHKSQTREGLNAHKGERIGQFDPKFFFLEIMGGSSSCPDNLISVTFPAEYSLHNTQYTALLWLQKGECIH